MSSSLFCVVLVFGLVSITTMGLSFALGRRSACILRLLWQYFGLLPQPLFSFSLSLSDCASLAYLPIAPIAFERCLCAFVVDIGVAGLKIFGLS